MGNFCWVVMRMPGDANKLDEVRRGNAFIQEYDINGALLYSL